jgi:putative FmdB family regulatory protein
MPLYEYRCRTCDEVFEVRKPMSESNAPAACPGGHADTVRLLSMFARAGAASSVAVERPTGGGCCGGACGCAR